MTIIVRKNKGSEEVKRFENVEDFVAYASRTITTLGISIKGQDDLLETYDHTTEYIQVVE